MDLTNLNIGVALPEVVLLTALFSILLVDLWVRDKQRHITHYLSIGAMLLVAGTQLVVWRSEATVVFHGLYIADGLSQLAKLVVY